LPATNTKLDGRSFEIEAKKLKEITGHEPRLLAKVDEPKNLPKALRKAGYSLLAITNRSYLIFKGDVFAAVPDCSIHSHYEPKLKFSLGTMEEEQEKQSILIMLSIQA
jgi:hypothetical protein